MMCKCENYSDMSDVECVRTLSLTGCGCLSVAIVVAALATQLSAVLVVSTTFTQTFILTMTCSMCPASANYITR